MTKFSLGLVALSFALLSPMAAQASGNSAVTNCALNVNTCVDGASVVGKTSYSYGINAGGASISDTNNSPADGNKQSQTVMSARVPAGQGSNGTMVPF
jgi:hypothetical protein